MMYRSCSSALLYSPVTQYTKLAAVSRLVQEAQAVRAFGAVPAVVQLNAMTVNVAAPCHVPEDARVGDLDKGLQHGDAGGDDGGGAFDAAA